jgi:pimeloyl-ACP methyl ester carboxylesterase
VESERVQPYLGGPLPTAGVDGRLAGRSAGLSARPFADVRRLLYTNRRSGLARGTTMTELAAEHADAITALGTGPVDVVGVSTGGSIAQQLAAEHPRVVRRLVLVSTGCRLSPNTAAVGRRGADPRRKRAARARLGRGGRARPRRRAAGAPLMATMRGFVTG